ncbi:MAG: helix-turn-helix domain-containing protein [Candidatus Woesearchaeota archaeon]
MNTNLLKKLGLNSYEIDIYILLIQHGKLTAKELAKISNVPPTAIYPNLKSLANKKLVFLINKEPLTYKAIDPKIGLNAYKESKNKELEEIEKQAVQELNQIQKSKLVEKNNDFLNIMKGWNQSANLVKKLLNESKKEFLLMSGMTTKTAAVNAEALRNAIKRGVQIRFILVKIQKENKKILQELTKIGIKIKYYPIDNFAVEVKDSEESVIVLRNPELEDRLVIHMKNKDLASAHRDYFYSVWKKAKQIHF